VELLFVALGGAILGLAVRYTLPHRTTQGWALLPAIGTAAASVFWVVLTWFGLKWDQGWIWWISLGLAAATVVVVDIMVTKRRIRADQLMLMSLMKTGAPRSA
jgi:ABC-type branched-subunit amino acid transport system permease subunit